MKIDIIENTTSTKPSKYDSLIEEIKTNKKSIIELLNKLNDRQKINLSFNKEELSFSLPEKEKVYYKQHVLNKKLEEIFPGFSIKTIFNKEKLNIQIYRKRK